MEIKNKVLGNYNETTFHYIHNHNDRFMINVTDIATHFELNLSDFLEDEVTKIWIQTLLKKDKAPLQYKVNGETFTSKTDYSFTFDDIVLLENGSYYFCKQLTYQLCQSLGMFYWWMDGLFFELMKKEPGKRFY